MSSGSRAAVRASAATRRGRRPAGDACTAGSLTQAPLGLSEAPPTGGRSVGRDPRPVLADGERVRYSTAPPRGGRPALGRCSRTLRGRAVDSRNPEIAQQLFVTRKTVETHLGHAYAKLNMPAARSSRTRWPIDNAVSPVVWARRPKNVSALLRCGAAPQTIVVIVAKATTPREAHSASRREILPPGGCPHGVGRPAPCRPRGSGTRARDRAAQRLRVWVDEWRCLERGARGEQDGFVSD